MVENSYAIVVVPLSEEDGGGFAAHVPDLPGCMSDGESQAEAIENALDAIECWIETARELGREVPAPGSSLDRARERDHAMMVALRAALDFAENVDGRIAKLEHDVERLIELMTDEYGRYGPIIASISSERTSSYRH